MAITLHQQLVTAFANGFTNGDDFASITSARKLAQWVLNQTIEPGTPIAKIVDESIEQGLILAARQLVQRSSDPIETWEQCLDLYDRQPALNTRTSTSILQQAYSTPVPIAFLAAKLAQIDGKTTVYEPTAGNGALLLLANPQLAIVNELNGDRALALRAQGFTVTEQDASSFVPATEAVDRIITNPPFGSVKDAQGQTRMFQRGRLTTSQLDNAMVASRTAEGIAHLQQKEHQLGQWNKLERTYSLWDKSPQTQEMRNFAKGLQSPQLQERLNSISKIKRQELARDQASNGRQAGLSV